jgi:hypothetical protein
LSDADIEHLYGGLMREAMAAFRADPGLLVEMAEAAAKIHKRQENSAANRVRRRASDGLP